MIPRSFPAGFVALFTTPRCSRVVVHIVRRVCHSRMRRIGHPVLIRSCRRPSFVFLPLRGGIDRLVWARHGRSMHPVVIHEVFMLLVVSRPDLIRSCRRSSFVLLPLRGGIDLLVWGRDGANVCPVVVHLVVVLPTLPTGRRRRLTSPIIFVVSGGIART
ncbi:hypothetical protein BDN72DRAFT_155339 [Pluteus cervinus]|uniref:Uncharacterized protein n=1 Tax=Pluteus cervinus TaxID=181527 RepID=A0ACD3AN11_9AGAR|nr:hypothetical protein BDN72DRAFT_155339 [Pluteus cervinus]